MRKPVSRKISALIEKVVAIMLIVIISIALLVIMFFSNDRDILYLTFPLLIILFTDTMVISWITEIK